MLDSPHPPTAAGEEARPVSERKKYCPFSDFECSKDCPLWMESHKKCAIVVIAEALDGINRLLLAKFLGGR